MITEFVVAAGERIKRLDAFLVSHERRVSRSRLQRLIVAGRIRVNANVVKPGQKIKPGDRITMDTPEAGPLMVKNEIVPLDVLLSEHVERNGAVRNLLEDVCPERVRARPDDPATMARSGEAREPEPTQRERDHTTRGTEGPFLGRLYASRRRALARWHADNARGCHLQFRYPEIQGIATVSPLLRKCRQGRGHRATHRPIQL